MNKAQVVVRAVKGPSEAVTRSFVAEWTALEVRGRDVDVQRAAFLTKWTKKLGAEAVAEILAKDIGLGPPTIGVLGRKVSVFARVPNHKTWHALGWRWVSRLASVEDDADLRRIERMLLDEAALKGGVLYDARVKAVLVKAGATFLLPKDREHEGVAGDAVFRRELERLVRSKILPLDKVDPYVAEVGGFAALLSSTKN